MEIIDEKREKNKANNRSLQDISKDSNELIFLILKNQVNSSVRKKRLSPSNKARKEASRNKFVQVENKMPIRVKSF